MRWNWHLMELLIFNFFFLEHIWPGPQNWWKQRRPFEVRRWWCTGLQFLWVWLSPLNLFLMPFMVSKTRDFSHNLLF
jgi:hypothetical protein